MKRLSKQEFDIICKLAIFTYLKEKYPDFIINPDERKDNINNLTKLFKKIEKLGHIPNKTKKIEEVYDVISNLSAGGNFDEEQFLNSFADELANLSSKDKRFILNCVIFVAHEDNELSDNEKEAILQIASCLGIEPDIKKIISAYRSSEFGKPVSKLFVLSMVFIMLLTIGVGAYFILNKSSDTIKIFNQEDVVFSEIYFNRYVVYLNTFDVKSELLQKQAVFYFSGSAEVSFKPQELKYNKLTKQITLEYKDLVPFSLKAHFNNPIIVDEIKPKGISKEQARTVGALVGIAGGLVGGIIGAKVGSLLSKVLPPPYKIFAAPAGGVAGGAVGALTGYFVTVNKLEGMQIVDEITLREKREITDASQALIIAALKADDSMINLYKKHFEDFITTIYSQKGYEIKDFNYVQYVEEDGNTFDLYKKRFKDFLKKIFTQKGHEIKNVNYAHLENNS